MGTKFIGNRKNKTLHAVGFLDGRCHIDQIREENKIEFDSLEEALKYPKEGESIFHKCGVCFLKMEKARNKFGLYLENQEKNFLKGDVVI